MGANLASSSRAKGGRRRKRAPMAEINVTPFVDVMLVLLIIFMVAAPLLTVGVPALLACCCLRRGRGGAKPKTKRG